MIGPDQQLRDAGSGRHMPRCGWANDLGCATGCSTIRTRVRRYTWPDQPGHPVTAAQLLEVEDRLPERIAAAREFASCEVVLGYPVVGPSDTGQRLYALACRRRAAHFIGTCWRRRRRLHRLVRLGWDALDSVVSDGGVRVVDAPPLRLIHWPEPHPLRRAQYTDPSPPA